MVRRLLPFALPFLIGAKRAPPDPGVEAATEALADMQIDTKVELLDAGAEPRLALRYRPKIGARADYEVKVAMDMGMSIVMPDGSAQELPLGGMIPPIITTARNTVGKPVSSGHIPVRVEYLDMRVEDAGSGMAGAMAAGLEPLKGMKFDMLIDPASGRPVQVDLSGDGNPELAAAMQSMMDQYVDRVVQFPDSPVGVGAKWKITMDMSVSGLQMFGTETLTVRDISKNAVELDMTMDLGLGDGGLDIPGLPPGAAVDVTEFVGTGSGTMRVDLQTLASEGVITIDMNMGMKMSMPGQGDAAMKMTMREIVETAAK